MSHCRYCKQATRPDHVLCEDCRQIINPTGSEQFTDEHIETAIQDFLAYGEAENGKSHQGYFAGDGFAARCLRKHLHILEQTRMRVGHH